MRELSVPEQRYQAALAVISDGRTVKEVAAGATCWSGRSWLDDAGEALRTVGTEAGIAIVTSF